MTFVGALSVQTSQSRVKSRQDMCLQKHDSCMPVPYPSEVHCMFQGNLGTWKSVLQRPHKGHRSVEDWLPFLWVLCYNLIFSSISTCKKDSELQFNIRQTVVPSLFCFRNIPRHSAMLATVGAGMLPFIYPPLHSSGWSHGCGP